MAIEAKVSLARQLEEKLSSAITVDGMNTLMRALYDVMDKFEITEKRIINAEQDDLFECYMSAIKVEGKSQKTIDLYRYRIRRTLKEIGVPVRKITVYHLREWIAREKARGIAESTLENNRQIMITFFGWLYREKLIDTNPGDNLGVIKVPKKKKRVYTRVEIRKLNEKCSKTRFTLRNRTIISFLESSGCRISEVLGLNRDEVNLQTGEFTVLGKGNKERKAYIDELTCELLKEYLAGRKDDNPALFIGQRRERLQPGGVQDMLRTIAKAAGLTNVHPHKFRRTLTTNLLRRGMPIQEVASLLGHEKLDTTMKYVVMNTEDVRNSYRRFA